MKNERYLPAALVGLFVDTFSRGELIPKSWFQERLGYDSFARTEENAHYMRAMGSVRNLLLHDHKIYLEDRGDCYYACLPREQAAIAQRLRAAEHLKACEMEKSIIAHTAIHKLTPEELKAHTDAENTAQKVSAFIEQFKKKKKHI